MTSAPCEICGGGLGPSFCPGCRDKSVSAVNELLGDCAALLRKLEGSIPECGACAVCSSTDEQGNPPRRRHHPYCPLPALLLRLPAALTPDPPPLRIYMACAYAEALTADAFGKKLVEELGRRGRAATVVSTWHAEAVRTGTTHDPESLDVQRELLVQNLQELTTADRLVVLGVLGRPRATFSEVGVFLCSTDESSRTVWVHDARRSETTNLFMSHATVKPIAYSGSSVFDPHLIDSIAQALVG